VQDVPEDLPKPAPAPAPAPTPAERQASTFRRRRSILKSTMVNSGLTILSRIVGLARETVRGYYLGTGWQSDAFGIASTLPNMLRRLFAEGAMTAAFVPVFSGLRADEDRERLGRFFQGFMTLFTLLMMAVTILGIAYSRPLVELLFEGSFGSVPGKLDLTVDLTQVMFPFLFLVSIASIIQATLNSFFVFGPSAFTPVLMNGVNILVVVLFHDAFPNPAWALSVGFLAGGVVQTAFQIPYLRGKGLKFRPTLAGLWDPAVWQVARIFLPGIFSAGIYQINVTIAQVIASSLDEGAVASLQYSLRLQELVLGVFAVSVATVLLPTMSEQVHRGDWPGVKETLRFSVGLLAFVTVPATAGLMLLATPIVRVLYEYGKFGPHSTEMTVQALYFHAAGIFFVAVQRNVVQVFYAMKDLKTPTWIAAFVMVLHALICWGLSVPLEQGGVAAAGSIAAAVNAGLLYWILWRRIGRLGTRALATSLLKTGLSTAAMVAAVGIPLYLGAFDGVRGMALAVRLLPAIVLAMGVYGFVAWRLGSEELSEFARLLKRKVAR
jgi:putative peptidoglycan lipid II flippase